MQNPKLPVSEVRQQQRSLSQLLTLEASFLINYHTEVQYKYRHKHKHKHQYSQSPTIQQYPATKLIDFGTQVSLALSISILLNRAFIHLIILFNSFSFILLLSTVPPPRPRTAVKFGRIRSAKRRLIDYLFLQHPIPPIYHPLHFPPHPKLNFSSKSRQTLDPISNLILLLHFAYHNILPLIAEQLYPNCFRTQIPPPPHRSSLWAASYLNGMSNLSLLFQLDSHRTNIATVRTHARFVLSGTMGTCTCSKQITSSQGLRN